MNTSDSRIQMLLVLSTTKELLSRLTENGWPDEVPSVSLSVINGMMDCLFDKNRDLPQFWNIQYAPTGPIQEIAMTNGWHSTYLVISEMYDKAASVFGR